MVQYIKLVYKSKRNVEPNKNTSRLENDSNKNDERVLAAVVIIRTDYG